MIKVSVMYPHTEGARFDHAYYRDKHMPLVKAKMGDDAAEVGAAGEGVPLGLRARARAFVRVRADQTSRSCAIVGAASRSRAARRRRRWTRVNPRPRWPVPGTADGSGGAWRWPATVFMAGAHDGHATSRHHTGQYW